MTGHVLLRRGTAEWKLMARFRPELRRRLLAVACTVSVAVAILFLPARVTAPARVVFTQAAGPAEAVVFNAAGGAAATAGTLRDALLSQDRARASSRNSSACATSASCSKSSSLTGSGASGASSSSRWKGSPLAS